MKLETKPELIAEVKRLKVGGKSGADIMRFLIEHGVIPGVGLLIYFCEAFRLEFADVAPIGGWSPDGAGELNDDAINAFTVKAIRSRR